MAKLNGDDETVAGHWGLQKDFAQRATEAVPDSLLRDIVGDALRGHDRRPMLPQKSGSTNAHSATEVVVPSFREWAHARLGVTWDEAKAKDYYDQLVTAGKDVGSLRPASPSTAPAVNAFANGRYGNAPLIPITPPPGVAQLDRLMDAEDRRDRAERAKNGGRW